MRRRRPSGCSSRIGDFFDLRSSHWVKAKCGEIVPDFAIAQSGLRDREDEPARASCHSRLAAPAAGDGVAYAVHALAGACYFPRQLLVDAEAAPAGGLR